MFNSIISRAIDLLIMGELKDGEYQRNRDEEVTIIECLALLVEKKDVSSDRLTLNR